MQVLFKIIIMDNLHHGTYALSYIMAPGKAMNILAIWSVATTELLSYKIIKDISLCIQNIDNQQVEKTSNNIIMW